MKTQKVLFLSLLFCLFLGCGKKSAADFNSNFILFKEVISSFTSGIISAQSDIRVVLASDKNGFKINEELEEDLFEISPNVSGKVVALSNNTIAFIPKKKLDPNTEYQVTFNVEKLDPNLVEKNKELAEFKFTVKTIKQDFVVKTLDLQSYSKQFQYQNCVLKTADVLDFETAKKLVLAEHDGEDKKILFEKSAPMATEFRFRIDSIQRQEKESILEISFDGTDFDMEQEGEMEVAITAINDFKVIKTETDNATQTLSINFSEPLKSGQDFNGLIAIENASNLKFATQGNVLKVYFNAQKESPKVVETTVEEAISEAAEAVADVDTLGVAQDTTSISADTIAPEIVEEIIEEPVVAPQTISGSLLLEVFAGIESDYDKKLSKDYTEKISFDQLKPNIRFVKNGTILPSSNNLKLNFEAVNLRAVEVKVYKIYKDNILQFLQDNELNGSRNLKRVGQAVAKTTLHLNESNLADLDKWTTFSIDLAKIITPDPGAIYRVEIIYKKKYSLYRCDNAEETNKEEEEEENEKEVNYSYNNYDDDYYYDDYDWRESEDPCSESYFYNAKIGTNVLASDIGVIAKRAENKSYVVAVSDLLTTDPMENATVELYSFQQQKLATQKTNSDGIATFQLDTFAYFAIVTNNKQATYVKLDDAHSLSVSNFNVAGQTLQKGLKGLIYGERGVWRPGDNLYLSFILNDAANKIPTGHPIKFRLSDPNGKISYQTVQNANEMHHYVFTVPTQMDAPTGNWEAMVSVGGAKFYKSIKIETIKPNRLKIKNSFNSNLLSASKTNTGTLKVNWLHGAIAKNLNVVMQAKFSNQKTVFKNYEKYIFEDAVRKFSSEEVTVFSGKLNENGTANVVIDPKIQGEAPGMLKAAFITKVYEEGGDFSTDVMVANYSPYATYVGIKTPEPNKYGMLETRKANQFDIVTVDENGAPKSVKNLEVKVYKVEWRWWWEEANDNFSNYNSDTATTAYKTFVLNTNSAGKAFVNFALSDEEWGRYLIRVSDKNNGHATSVSVNIDWPIWSGKTRNTNASNANMLVFSTDKNKYAVGEEAQISIPSTQGGRALVSVESGARILETFWVKTTQGETKIALPITAKMAPNVFINISLIQPHANTKNDLPIRMYGIVPIEVVDKNTVLLPQISMPDVLRPEQTFSVKVNEKSGKAMSYTIAVVEEGLLDLTRFTTPNVWDSFYVKEALGVKTWDIYDDVIGAYGGKVNQIFSIGGDQDLGGSLAKKANRFKPVVVYLGPFNLEKGQSKTHEIKLPKYIGSVKTMVVASNVTTSAYGSIEKTTAVKSPLMVLASLPRKISPSEKVTIPVTIFTTEKHIKTVTVQLKTSNGIQIIGAASQKIQFTSPDEKMAYFNLAVGSDTGIGKVQVIATSGNEKSVYEVEIDKTNPNPSTTTYTDAIISPNTTKTMSWKTFGVAGSNRAVIEISSMPTINFNGRLQYLIQYPHGCVEQTTSSVFPQLYLNDVTDLDATRQSLIQKNIAAGIVKLNGFQLSNGGLNYWQGNSTTDDWGTSYAGHFMIEAERKGYYLPVNFKSKWISFQQNEAKKWRFEKQYGNDFAQAYRLYTLALAGVADLSSMNRLRETKNTSNECKLRLAAAYALAGQKNAGMSLLLACKIDSDENYQNYYYGSTERNRAMMLETMVLLGLKQKAFENATKLAKQMSSDTWMSTQTTAFCLYAMSKFSANNGIKGTDITISNQAKVTQYKSNKVIITKNLLFKMGANTIVLKNNKNNTLFVRVLNTGILPIGQENEIKNNVAVSLLFKDRKGSTITVTKITQGTEFIAEVKVKNLKNETVNNVALSQIIPSGFEIVNTRFTDYGEAVNSPADYVDTRDDRNNFYFSIGAGVTKTFRTVLNASYLGTYYLPGLQCEAMYDNSFLARNKGFWVQVVN